MGVKLELTISRAETIQPKQDEVIYSLNWDNGQNEFFDNGSIYSVIASVGKTITFETENSVILDFIKWVDEIWTPFIHEYTSHNKVISQQKFNEWDKKCVDFEKAITAETGYNFKTEFNEFTDENTIECVRTDEGIYWEFGF